MVVKKSFQIILCINRNGGSHFGCFRAFSWFLRKLKSELKYYKPGLTNILWTDFIDQNENLRPRTSKSVVCDMFEWIQYPNFWGQTNKFWRLWKQWIPDPLRVLAFERFSASGPQIVILINKICAEYVIVVNNTF